MKKYYSILRPVGPGTAPRGFVSFENFPQRTYIEEIGREAWGYLIYNEELKNPERWDLIEGGKEINMNKRLYLAYGSNMSVEQMAYRCPDATIVGTAVIENYRLMYKGSKTGAYATIEPEEGQQVPVLVWEISRTDELKLDRYEGYNEYGYSFYNKKVLYVDITTLAGKHLGVRNAMVYIMDESRKHGIPTTYYEGILREGYERFGFDTSILDRALIYTAQKTYGKNAVKLQ